MDKDQPELDLIFFLAETAPGPSCRISNAVSLSDPTQGILALPKELSLYCDDDTCNRTSLYDCADTHLKITRNFRAGLIVYKCRHCKKSQKHFAIVYAISAPNSTDATLCKFGEFPSFGPPLPSKLLSLIRADQQLFSFGQRSENQGMGLGAFAYYRRVVENQKNQLFSAIIKIAEKVGQSEELITQLEAAKQQRQFSTAIKLITAALPERLMIKGQNPLLMLHSALSYGLHGEDDARCLELAGDVREVLSEFAVRVAAALQENTRLEDAVRRLGKVGTQQDRQPESK